MILKRFGYVEFVGSDRAISRCCSSRHFYAFVWYCQVSITSDDVEQFSALVSPKEFDNEHAKNIQKIPKDITFLHYKRHIRLAV